MSTEIGTPNPEWPKDGTLTSPLRAAFAEVALNVKIVSGWAASLDQRLMLPAMSDSALTRAMSSLEDADLVTEYVLLVKEAQVTSAAMNEIVLMGKDGDPEVLDRLSLRLRGGLIPLIVSQSQPILQLLYSQACSGP